MAGEWDAVDQEGGRVKGRKADMAKEDQDMRGPD